MIPVGGGFGMICIEESDLQHPNSETRRTRISSQRMIRRKAPIIFTAYMQCHKSSKMGHLARDCPEKKVNDLDLVGALQ